MSIDIESVLERADYLYDEVCSEREPLRRDRAVIRSEQVKSIARAIIEAVNEELG